MPLISTELLPTAALGFLLGVAFTLAAGKRRFKRLARAQLDRQNLKVVDSTGASVDPDLIFGQVLSPQRSGLLLAAGFLVGLLLAALL